MRHVYKTRHFNRWARKAGVQDVQLCGAVHEMVQGLVDADLGGHLFKKRLALAGRGKRGGLRTIIATRKQRNWFFIHGFEKNVQANVSVAELEALKELAVVLLGSSEDALAVAVHERILVEICRDEQS